MSVGDYPYKPPHSNWANISETGPQSVSTTGGLRGLLCVTWKWFKEGVSLFVVNISLSILSVWMQIITSFTSTTLCMHQHFRSNVWRYWNIVVLDWSGSCYNQLAMSVWLKQSSANYSDPGLRSRRPHFQESEVSPSLPRYAMGHFALTVWISPTFLVSLRPLMDLGKFTLQETEMLLNVIHSCVWHRRHFIFLSELFRQTD